MVSRLITRYVKGQTGRTAYREARGHDAQAPVAEFGDNTMYTTSNSTNKSGLTADAKFHDGMWLAMRTKSDESIIETPDEVIKAKTVRRLPEDDRWRAEEVFNFRGIPPNPVQALEETTSQLKSAGQGMPNVEKMGTHQHKSVRSVTLAQQLPHRSHSQENVYNQGAHQRIWHHSAMPRMQGDRSRRINATRQRMQDEDKGENRVK